jgi:DNA-binding NarL/FixJ family response regulator
VFEARHADIALVLLDIRMPGMDGVETLRALQRVDPGVRCCFMSGDLGQYNPASLESTGALQLFPKPFLLWDLLAALCRLTGMETPGEQG